MSGRYLLFFRQLGLRNTLGANANGKRRAGPGPNREPASFEARRDPRKLTDFRNSFRANARNRLTAGAGCSTGNPRKQTRADRMVHPLEQQPS